MISHSYLLCACENTSVLLWADLSDRTVSRVTHEVPRPPSRSREPVPLAALPFPQAPGLVSALRFRDSDFSCPGSAGATASGPWVSPSDALAGQGGRGAPARCRERQDFRLSRVPRASLLIPSPPDGPQGVPTPWPSRTPPQWARRGGCLLQTLFGPIPRRGLAGSRGSSVLEYFQEPLCFFP